MLTFKNLCQGHCPGVCLPLPPEANKDYGYSKEQAGREHKFQKPGITVTVLLGYLGYCYFRKVISMGRGASWLSFFCLYDFEFPSGLDGTLHIVGL